MKQKSRDAITAPALQCSSPAAAHHEIPPAPPIPAPVAALTDRRNAARVRAVLTAEAALRATAGTRTATRSDAQRRADRSGRDSDGAPRTSTTRHAKRQAKARSSGEVSATARRERLANARVHGRKAADRGAAAEAGPDETPGAPVAGTASLGDPGCSDLGACAGLALSPPDKNAMTRTNSSATAAATATNDNLQSEVQRLKTPTNPLALADGPSYVRAVAQHVDLVGASARLVVSADEKVSKAELDRLRELIFGKGGPPPLEEPLHIDWSSIPRPDREPARFDPSTQGAERDDN